MNTQALPLWSVLLIPSMGPVQFRVVWVKETTDDQLEKWMDLWNGEIFNSLGFLAYKRLKGQKKL